MVQAGGLAVTQAPAWQASPGAQSLSVAHAGVFTWTQAPAWQASPAAQSLSAVHPGGGFTGVGVGAVPAAPQLADLARELAECARILRAAGLG